MNQLELKIPPLLLVLLIGGAMWLLPATLALPAALLAWAKLLAIGSALVGSVICIAGVVAMRMGHTTVNPTNPAATVNMVTFGIYSITRNPMYLGFLLWLTGWAFYLANGLGFLFLPGFVLYMNRFQIIPEERVLAGKFSAQFEAYRARVRRWI